jgi:preprotein translocase SecF subunit
VRYGNLFTIAPAVILLVGIILLCIPAVGFNLGLDFTGGSIVAVSPEDLNSSTKNAYIDTIKTIMDKNDVKADIAMEKNSTGNILTVKFSETDNEITDKIIADLSAEFGDDAVGKSDTISASTSSEKIVNIILAILAALFGILIYMLFRFKFTSGIAAVIALFHDVAVMAAFVIIFRVQINSSFIAALITIIGYSLNNTLVLFDRVRTYENANVNNYTLEHILDKSIKDTLGRTMITTITTFVPVFVLTICSLIMQLSSLTEFALPIIFGLIAGTYSSPLVAMPLYLRFESARLINKKHKLNTNKQSI